MRFIIGKDRKQSALFPVTLEESIGLENEVRAIDLFVNGLDLEKMGFKVCFPEGGRPAYHPAVLLKLFIYGYLNRIRSSRMLEKECKRNIEMMWLLEQLTPDHNTIANFRKDNPDPIKRVFRSTVQLARNFNLIGGKIIAGDGTKLRAQNSKKNNFNPKKIDRHLQYIDNKLEQYNRDMAKADGEAEKEEIQKNIKLHSSRKEGYKKLQQELKETGEPQISTSDPESRQMIIRGSNTEVAYNVQSTVDAKHCIPIDYEVTNQNDKKAIGAMVRRAKSILGTTDFTALFDKGYYTGSELGIVQGLGIKALVAVPDKASTAPDLNYNAQNFTYEQQNDIYTCPEGHQLTTNGKFYLKYRGTSNQTEYKQYRTKACKSCPVKNLCTKAKNGKVIERTIFTPMYEENRKNIEEDPELYRRRQAIVEHPFGTIKRQWGFDHILSKKSKKRASADVGFIFIAYNLKRILNLMGKKGLWELHGHFTLCSKILMKDYKAILMTLNHADLAIFYFCSNRNPNPKELILVHNEK